MFLRVDVVEAGTDRCSRETAPLRERTTDWNGTGIRQHAGADGRTSGVLGTGRPGYGEGRLAAGQPWCSIHRFDTMKPGETTRVRRRTLATSCGERTSFGRHRRRERATRTTRDFGRPRNSSSAGGCETTRRSGATSSMRAGMRPRRSTLASGFPGNWGIPHVGSTRGHDRRTERKSQRRQKLAFLARPGWTGLRTWKPDAPPRGAPECKLKSAQDGAGGTRCSHLEAARFCKGRRPRAAVNESKPHPPSAASDPLAGETQPKRGWPWRQGPAPPGENPTGYGGALAAPADEANGPDHA